MSGGVSQNSLRKALGSIKDTTTVSLAKINSDYTPPLSAVSATRPRADVAYCIHALARRLAKIHNWAVCTQAYNVYYVITPLVD